MPIRLSDIEDAPKGPVRLSDIEPVESNYPVDPAGPPISPSSSTDAVTALKNIATTGARPLGKGLELIGIPFERAGNLAAAALYPPVRAGSELVRAGLDAATAKVLGGQLLPEERFGPSMKRALKDIADKEPDIIKNAAKSLVGPTPKETTRLGDIMGVYHENVTGKPSSPMYELGYGLAAEVLIEPAVVGKAFQVPGRIARAMGVKDKIEAAHPTAWKIANLERRAGISERVGTAEELALSTQGKTVQKAAQRLSEVSGKTIGPRAVEKRLSQIIKGGVSQQEDLKSIANPIIREFESNARILEQQGILDKARYTQKLTRKQMANLVRQRESAKKKLTRLETAPHYVGTSEISARFPGRANQINKLKEQIEGINERIAISDVYGGTKYHPRMYLSKENEIRRGVGIYNPKRIRAPYARGRKNIPEDVRQAMGEIKTPAFPVMKRMIQQAQDIENSKLFDFAAKRFASKEWKPGLAKKAIPDDKAYGALRGQYVPKRIFDDVTELNRIRSKGEQIYDRSIGAWKMMKVPLNPSTHFRNMTTNKILNHYGGMEPQTQFKYALRAVKEIRQNTTNWKEAKKYFGKTSQMSGEILDDLLRRYGDGSDKGITAILRRGRVGPRKYGLSNLYQQEEVFDKFVRYLWRRDNGMSHIDAILDANKWLIDYGDLTKFEKSVMRRIAPFYTFPRKVTPLVFEAMGKNPYTVAQYPLAAWAMEKYSLAKLEMDEKDYSRIRKIMPEYARDGGYLLMPYRDTNGDLRFFDWTYIIPWGPMTDFQSRGALNVVFSNPIFQLVGDFQRNKSSFTGREIWKETDTWREKKAKQILYTWQAAMPSLAPKGLYWDKLYDAMSGRKSIQGKKRPVPETVAHTLFGMRTQALDPKLAKVYRVRDLYYGQAQELQSKMKRLSLERNVGRITEKEYQQKLSQYKSQLEQVNQKLKGLQK